MLAVGDGIVGVTCSETTLGGWSWFGIGGCADSLLDLGAGVGSDVGCGPDSGPKFDTSEGSGSDFSGNVGSGADFSANFSSSSGFGADVSSGSAFGADVGSGLDSGTDVGSGLDSGSEFDTGDFGAVGGFVAKGLGLCPPAPTVGGATAETGGYGGPDEAVIIIGVPPPNTCVSSPKPPEKELFLP